MLYRLFRPEDFEALYAVEKICFQPPFRFGRAFMLSLVDSPDAATWIAEEDGRLTAFAVVEWTRHASGTTAYLQTIEVLPLHRGHGVASELLQRVESSARAARASALWLHVDTTNADAIRLYEKHGYVFRGKTDHYYAPDRGALIYQKRLLQ